MPLVNPVVIGAIAVALFLLVAVLKVNKKPETALSQEYKRFKIYKKQQMNHNVVLFRIEFEKPGQILGLPVGQHVYLRFFEGEKPISRAYTPVSLTNQKGYCDLIIKIYPEGKMGKHLIDMPNGEGYIEMRGPAGRLQYQGKSQFSIRRGSDDVVRSFQNVAMLAGGSGLTPMLQIIRAVSEDPRDLTNVHLIFANQEEADIVQREELDALAEKFANIHVYYNLDRPSANWTGGSGYVTEQTLKDAEFPPVGDDSLFLVCGPPPMCHAMERLFQKIGCEEKNYFIF